tara:strand:+ start:13 stop:711 length:699 start_codon:yes stop_codon:yes gene_type:complete
LKIEKKILLFRILKRFIDIIFSLTLLILFLPILIPVSILSIIVQGWPPFYISKRFVSEKSEINIIKFRTMVKDAKSNKYNLSEKYMKDGYLDIPLTSNVFTPLGRILEKTQIVEIPQILPIFFGKISFVGNRPLPFENINQLKKKFPNDWKKRFHSPAGMTGISQIVGKFNITPKQRLELESLYSEVYLNGNIIKVDIYIVLSTIILLIVQSAEGYRSYNNAKKMLISCLYK